MKKSKRKSFSQKNMVPHRDLTHQYHEYDKKYFGSKLPNIEVFMAPMNSPKDNFRYGITGFGAKDKPLFICLNKKLDMFGDDISYLTLLHEMIHVKCPKLGDTHGPAFLKEVIRLRKLGAFDDLI